MYFVRRVLTTGSARATYLNVQKGTWVLYPKLATEFRRGSDAISVARSRLTTSPKFNYGVEFVR